VFEQLRAGGVTCAGPTGLSGDHENRWLSTTGSSHRPFNFCDKYFTLTRDYGLILDDVEIASEVSACFAADWEGRTFDVPVESRLIWSNRPPAAPYVISSTGETRVLLQHPKFSDVTVLDGCCTRQHRGVHVRILSEAGTGSANPTAGHLLVASLAASCRRHRAQAAWLRTTPSLSSPTNDVPGRLHEHRPERLRPRRELGMWSRRPMRSHG